MRTLTKFISSVALAVLTASSYAADINVMSWNVKRLGHGGQQSYAALGAISARADIVAVQEVMTEQGLERLEVAIEKASNEKWSRIES